MPDAQIFVTPVQHLQQSPVPGQQLQEVAEEDANNATPPQGAMKLACPFLKYDPQRYMNGPFCQSSWHSVRDVKYVVHASRPSLLHLCCVLRDRFAKPICFREHVFRQHMQPKFRCNRCMETFDDSRALVFHQRLPEPCRLGEWAPDEGCDEEQKDKIRKGDKGDGNARWKRMFRILFPNVDSSAIPDGVVYDNAYFAPTAIDPVLNVSWQGETAQIPEGVA